jgi:hypothetical protein
VHAGETGGYNACVRDQRHGAFELPDINGGISSSPMSRPVVVANYGRLRARTSSGRMSYANGANKWGRYVNLLRVASNASGSAAVRGSCHRKHIPCCSIQEGCGRLAQTTPHAFVISDTGKLRYRGAVDDTNFSRRDPTRFYLEEAVDAVLSGKAPAVSDTQPYGCAIIRHALE